MRIASLVPSATEILFALGLGPDLVAVTHECDYPAEACGLPQLTRSVLAPGLDAAGIDAAVREHTAAGEALYELDEAALARLEPDLIVTQAVCPVCAVSYDDVLAVAARLPSAPRVLSLDPSRLQDVLGDVFRVGEVAGIEESALRLQRELAWRIRTVRELTAGLERPRVAALEWLDPPYAAGHWVPEMIAAGGGYDTLAEPGTRSRQIGWEEIEGASADVIVVMPCGLDVTRSAAEAERHAAELEACGAARVVAVDAAASFSRPGPRLADGVELLGHLLHPDGVPPPPGLEARLMLRSAER